MRVLLSTIGSDGDIQPFLALGQRLIAAGHEVQLATTDRYEARSRALGVPFVAVGPPWNDATVKALFARIFAERNPMRQVAIVVDGLVDDQKAAVPELVALAKRADVVVYSPLCVAGAVAARAANKKHVSVHLAPAHRAQAYGPGGGNLGRLGNKIAWALAASLLRRATDPRLNEVVTAGGLSPWRDVMLDASHSRLLDLVAASPAIVPRDPLWRPETRVTGYLFVDEPAWTPPRELESFVEDAEPPVVIGFGSMQPDDPEAVTALIAEATAGLKRRVVVQAGWAGLGRSSPPRDVHVAGFVSHEWLLPRAACLVHHGGAGTTGAAARAGIPQAIAWHVGDQPVWGRRVHDLGIGPDARPFHRMNTRWLRAAIRAMLEDDGMRERACSLGATIRAEDGAINAVRAIEQVVA